MKQITFMVGFPGSGKSTQIKQMLEGNPDAVVISPDEIREEYCGGNRGDQSKNKEVWAEAYFRTVEAFASEATIIFDATLVSKKSRKTLIEISKKAGYSITAFWVDTPVEECIRRQPGREWPVPNFVIHRMAKNFEEPSRSEGIDVVVHKKWTP